MTPLYEQKEFSFQVTNKFNGADYGEFYITVIQEKRNKEVKIVEEKPKKGAKKPQTAGGNKPQGQTQPPPNQGQQGAQLQNQ